MQHELDQVAIDIYKYALVHPTWTPHEVTAELGLDERALQAALNTLCALKLLRPSPDKQRAFDPVGPESALAELLTEEELDVRRRDAELAEIRGHVMSLVPHYFAARRARRSQEAIDVVDAATARDLLKDRSRRAQRQMLVAHPGGGIDAQDLSHSLENDLAILESGLELRVLLQHATRGHAPTAEWARVVGAAGAQIRTVPRIPNRFLIADGEWAMLPREGGDVGEGAVVAREPGVVDFLVAVHETLWETAVPYPTAGDDDDTSDGDGSESLDRELSRAVLGQMATGAKDEVIARRLGISVRTCRRHIAQTMSDLGADSRFQAGVEAVRQGLFDS